MKKILMLASFLMLEKAVLAQNPDYKLAPNSYIFDPFNNASNDGIMIPVKKAYEMWASNNLISDAGSAIPAGVEKAEVYWEDEKGLIKCGMDYGLVLVGTGDSAKIKVPINKSKTGNAVVVYKVNNEIYWSWHVWVTDDPTNGSDYRAYTAGSIQRVVANNTLEDIPAGSLKFMDRNLGAVGFSNTGNKWNKSGGLLYQWGRKDPFPPLVSKADDFYEVVGSVGRLRHRHDHTYSTGTKFDDVRLMINRTDALVQPNLRTSIKNPASLIYIVNDNTTNQAFYNNNAALPINWFGRSPTLTDPKLTELNLWSDNSRGIVPNPPAHNYNSQRGPYRTKSSWDPCPNGWRMPSMFTAALGGYNYRDDVRSDYSPFGFNTTTGKIKSDGTDSLERTVFPHDEHSPAYKKGVKLYPNLGFDMTNVNEKNMGHFPGTGIIHRNLNLHGAQYTDQHEVHIWTATMTRWFDASPAVSARKFYALPDASQWVNNYKPDVAHFPNVWGWYVVDPLSSAETSEAAACRCISDPLYVSNSYNFPTEYFSENVVEYRDGVNNPNTYALTKSTLEQLVTIPVNKAFSVQSLLLNNPSILNNVSYNNLKTNVLWTTNTNLIKSIELSAQPNALSELSNTNILVSVNANQVGNAVVTLHNGSITNPVLWSWHVWVTNTPIDSVDYVTKVTDPAVTNYLKYVKKGISIKTRFMDRDLGAIDAFPTVLLPSNVSTPELNAISNSGGFQYQWGRKDPLPPFLKPDGSTYDIYLGTKQSNGSISYTTLNAATYNTNPGGSYIVPYNTYSLAAGVSASDKFNEIVEKNIRYSIANPMQYLIPSSYVPFNSANGGAYANGTDWTSGSNESNVAPDRWGHADKKSPFDPCPSGWRIPDVMSANADTLISLNPWNKQELSAAQTDIINQYNGIKIGNYGYNFYHPDYTIGNYATVGARGMRSVIFNGPIPNHLPSIDNTATAGWWTSSLTSHQYGRGLALTMRDITNVIRVHYGDLDPAAALNCRCVKVNYDTAGTESWTGTPVSIKFKSFAVSCKGNKANIYWEATDNDATFSHYEIYKSSDAKVWQKIAEVAKNVNSEHNTYHLEDDASNENAYYFLRMMYIDGQNESSKVLALNCYSKNATWSVFPNPGKGSTSLTIASEREFNDILSIVDINGKEVYQQNVFIKNGNNEISLNLNKLSNGQYFVQLKNQKTLFPTLKFVKID